MRKGILGGFVGKVGTVIGSQRSGMDIISSLPKKSSKAPTVLQSNQREKFGLAVGFLQPINELLKLGFKASDPRFSSFNLAIAHMLQNSIIGESGSYELDYPKVLISKGELSPAWNAVAATSGASELSLTWSNATNSGMSNPDDEVFALVYNADTKQHLMSISAATRADGVLSIPLPNDFVGSEVQCWLAFTSKDKKQRSTSIYAGAVTIV
ncbi:DUF6266 family protein [Pedobacter alpinus]